MEKKETTLNSLGFGLAALIFAIVFVSLVSSISYVSAAQNPAISVSPASLNVSHGQTFTINITADPKGNEICAAQYALYFNPLILNATSQTQGPFLSQDGAETFIAANIINNTVGKVEYGESRTGEGLEHGVTTPGALASITFEVIGTPGMCNLKLSDVILIGPNAEELKTEINHAVCTVGSVTGLPAVAGITIEEAHEMIEGNPEEIILLDVRTEGEHNAEYIYMPDVELKNIPKDELENRLGELDKSKKIILYSKTGSKSRTAGEILVQHGFESVYNLLGGIESWKINFPVVKPTPTPAASPSPTPTVAPTPVIEGFEAIFVIIALLAISCLTKIKGRDAKK